MKANEAPEKIYIFENPILDKISTSKRNAELFLDGYDIHYRNHKKSKSGKLVSCEVFFTKQKAIDVEIV